MEIKLTISIDTISFSISFYLITAAYFFVSNFIGNKQELAISFLSGAKACLGKRDGGTLTTYLLLYEMLVKYIETKYNNFF